MYMKIKASSLQSMALGMSSAQRSIDSLTEAARSWGLDFNIAKCVAMRYLLGTLDPHLVASLGALAHYYLDGEQISFTTTHKDLGVLVDNKLKYHAHILSTTQKAAGMANNIIRSTLCRSPTFMRFIWITYVRPIIEFGSTLWNSGYVTDLRLLESVQRRWTKNVQGLENLPYNERISSLNLFSIRGRLIRADLILYWKIFHDHSTIKPADLFSLEVRPGNRGHPYKIATRFARSETRRRSFSFRQVAIWNDLPQAVVTSSSLAVFKRNLLLFRRDLLYEYYV